MKNNIDKNNDTNLELTLNEFANILMKNQKDLPSEIQQYLNEHIMDLV